MTTTPSDGGMSSGPRVLMLAQLDNWMFHNLIPSLRRVCSQVYAYPYGDTVGNWHVPKWPQVRARSLDRIVSDIASLVKGPGLDLVFTYAYDDVLPARDARRIRDLGVPIVGYNVDMNAQWYRSLGNAAEMDMLAISHMQYTEPLLRRGARVHFMPMAASPDRYLAEGGSAISAPGVLMLGSANASRVQAVSACCEVTPGVDVVGSGWDAMLASETGSVRGAVHPSIRHPFAKRIQDAGYIVPRLMAEGKSFVQRTREYGRKLPMNVIETARKARLHGVASDADIPALLRGAAITLGVNQRRGWIGDRDGVADSRLRDFEAPMSGAFYLVQSFCDLPLFYRLGEEVESWSTLAELQSKVKYFVDHPSEAKAIAQAGRIRACRDHSWDARLRDMLHVMGLPRKVENTQAPLRVLANLSSSPWCADSPGCQPSEGDPRGPSPEWKSLTW